MSGIYRTPEEWKKIKDREMEEFKNSKDGLRIFHDIHMKKLKSEKSYSISKTKKKSWFNSKKSNNSWW